MIAHTTGMDHLKIVKNTLSPRPLLLVVAAAAAAVVVVVVVIWYSNFTLTIVLLKRNSRCTLMMEARILTGRCHLEEQSGISK
jgi:hypothetical protein